MRRQNCVCQVPGRNLVHFPAWFPRLKRLWWANWEKQLPWYNIWSHQPITSVVVRLPSNCGSRDWIRCEIHLHFDRLWALSLWRQENIWWVILWFCKRIIIYLQDCELANMKTSTVKFTLYTINIDKVHSRRRNWCLPKTMFRVSLSDEYKILSPHSSVHQWCPWKESR